MNWGGRGESLPVKTEAKMLLSACLGLALSSNEERRGCCIAPLPTGVGRRKRQNSWVGIRAV